MSFSFFNLYTFAAARGRFLDPDVQALLKAAPVGFFSDLVNPSDPALRHAAETARRRLDLLLFGEPPRPAKTRRPPLALVP